MKNLRVVAATALALACMAGAVRAQSDSTQPPPRGGRGPLGQGRGRNPNGAPLNRAQLERRVTQEFTKRAREVVGLTDDQITKLQPINAKYIQQRQQLRRQQAAAQMGMRAELGKGDAADPAKVDQFSTQLQQTRRQQLDLDEAERKDLGTVMTPLQTAKYLNLRDQIMQRMVQMQRGQIPPGARGDSAGPPRPPAGARPPG
jgi:hypothetical protein